MSTATQQLSSYREQQHTIAPGQLLQVSFSDTMPNHFYLNNLSTADVYLGISILPDPTKYDLYVGPSEQRVTGRDKGVQQAYLFNDSPSPATVVLTTFSKPFDPTVLIGTNASGGTSSRPSSGIISGFTVPLPAGNNNIGNVDIETMPPLPAGTNNIGQVIVPNAITIGAMPPIEVTNDPVRGYHHMFDGAVDNVTVVVVDFAPLNVTKFSYITNDDTVNDLFIAFNDDPIVTTGAAGKDGTIRLKPGESLTDLGRMASKIRFVRAAGNGTVRMLGV